MALSEGDMTICSPEAGNIAILADSSLCLRHNSKTFKSVTFYRIAYIRVNITVVKQ